MKHFYFLILFAISSIIYSQPPPEGGIELNGIDEHVPVPNSDNINTTSVSSRTIEMYFKVDNGTSRQVLFEEGGGTNAFVMYVENGFIHAGAFKDNGGTGNSIFFREPISNDIWYHVTLVLDNSTSLKFYLDGVLIGNRTSAFAIPSHSGGIDLGRSSSNLRYPSCATWTSELTSEYCLDNLTAKINANYYFAGHIWGFRTWNDARTATEINNNKDILITDTTANPDLLMVLESDGTITYLASDNMYAVADPVGSVLDNINEDISEEKFKIFTSNNQLNIKVSEAVSNPKVIKLYSVLGKKVVDKNYQEQIDVSFLSKGIYLVLLEFENKQRIVKKVIL